MGKINLRIVFPTLLIISFLGNLKAQSFNDDKTAFTSFIKRMYAAAPFERVRIIDDYDHQYLVSIISLDTAKYTDPSVMMRVAQVKAMSQANTYLNGGVISSDVIVKTSETKSRDSTVTVVKIVETIKQIAAGFVRGMELLTNFDDEAAKRMVFVHFREIEEVKK